MNKFVTLIIALGAGMLLALIGCAPSPESMASASATVMRAQQVSTEAAVSLVESAHGTQTAVAVSASGMQTAQALDFNATRTVGTRTAEQTQTADARSARQTDTVWKSQVNATRTAEPYNAALVATRANTEQSNQLAGSAGLWGMLAILGLIGLAVYQMVRTRAGIIPRAANGQLPAVRIGNTVFNPGQELGPVTVHNPGVGVRFVWNAYVLWCMIRRQKPEMSWQPRATIETTNANATADHLLAAHQATQLPQTMAAMFQPIWRGWLGRGDPARERQERVQLAQQASGLLLTPVATSAPSGQVPQIVAGNESQAHEIAQALGHDLTGIVQGEVRYLPQPSLDGDSGNDEKDA